MCGSINLQQKSRENNAAATSSCEGPGDDHLAIAAHIPSSLRVVSLSFDDLFPPLDAHSSRSYDFLAPAP